MSDKEFMMRLHGDFDHCNAIWTGKYVLKMADSKYQIELKDERQFKKLHQSPCEPDIYFTMVESFKQGSKTVKQKVSYVIEFETKASLESIKKKQQQYTQALVGVRLLVIDLDDFWGKNGLCAKDNYKASDLLAWVSERMPI